MNRAIRLPLLAALYTLVPVATVAAPKLYDTGPAQDLALVRFVNASAQPLTVQSGSNSGGAKASIVVAPAAPSPTTSPRVPTRPSPASGSRAAARCRSRCA